MADQDDEERARRAELRAFVRDNHPDVGGDPEAFVAGLARLRAAGQRTPEPDRFDAPVVFHDDAHLLHRLIVAVLRWQQRRRKNTRVQ